MKSLAGLDRGQGHAHAHCLQFSARVYWPYIFLSMKNFSPESREIFSAHIAT